jgi:hypothetical protein
MRTWPVLILAALALAACETPTVFAPAATPGASGYTETRIEQDRWRVTFRGGSDADQRRVEDLTLLRAAQLTLQQGYDWFRITERYNEAEPPRGPTLSVDAGTEDYGRHGGSSFGVGVGGIPLGGGPILAETVEIVMGKGQRPNDPGAYDAHDVARSIAPPSHSAAGGGAPPPG